MKVVLLPGFNGAARQPLLVRVAEALGAGFEPVFPGLPRGRPSPGFETELAHLKAFTRGRPVVIGRSFGGRVALRHALHHPVRQLVLLGFPVRPPGRPRPEEEAALRAVKVPTLIVQGSKDEKGPLAVLRPLVRANPALTLVVLKGAGHDFGRSEREAIEHVRAFLA